MQDIDILLRKIKSQESEDYNILNLNANENRMSNTARKMLITPLSDRYNLGSVYEHGFSEIVSLGDFTFKGLKNIYEIEAMSKSIAKELFKAKAIEFRFLSGVHAMISCILALTEVGDSVYSIHMEQGGHFATPFLLKQTGRKPLSITMDKDRLCLDLKSFSNQFVKEPAKMIYLDIGCPLFPVPLKKLREIVGPKTIIVYDASHTLGLIAGQEFQSPLLEGADILQGNTHKTFPGPQKALMMFKDDAHAEQVRQAMTQGLVSNRHNHHDLALFITLLEMQCFGADYAKQMACNAQVLAHMLEQFGIKIVNRNGQYTKSHIILIDGNSVGGHVKACKRLLKCNIATNSRHGFMQEVIRVGVQEVTRRGMKEKDMLTIAKLMKKALIQKLSICDLKNEVNNFNKSFKKINYSFD